MWPLIAIVSLLAVALIAIIIVFAVQPSDDDGPTSPPPTTPSKPASETPSTEPTSDTVRIDRGDFEGRPAGEVTDDLLELDPTFQIEIAPDSPAAPSPDKVGTVKTISPSGNVPKGSTIRLTVYGDFPPPGAPETPTASPTQGDVGDGVTISFPTYAKCPAGYALQGYTFTLVNATTTEANPGASATSITIELGPTAGSDAKVSYVAHCANGIDSQQSGQATITVNP
jgi:serine/threonine-protein kinase